jgi:REP element-mobilizing transposase RayT
MPRKVRVDTHGALHHIIVRGIERQKIFYDDLGQNSFLERLGVVLTETSTPCFARALIPNHSKSISHERTENCRGASG